MQIKNGLVSGILRVLGKLKAKEIEADKISNSPIYFDSNSLPSVTNQSYILGINSFADGGQMVWSNAAAGSNLGLVKSGGDVTISSGTITVNDDSHNHTIANIDSLQATLNDHITNITANGKTVTFTKQDGTTGTFTTQDTDTHHTTGLKVGASATATANAAATNDNVYLNVLDNSTVRDSHKITGSGATTVTSDANGVITVTSANTQVTQSQTTSTKWRSVLTGYEEMSTTTATPSSQTNVAYKATGVAVQPSTGTMRATQYNVADGVSLVYDSSRESLKFNFGG